VWFGSIVVWVSSIVSVDVLILFLVLVMVMIWLCWFENVLVLLRCWCSDWF